MESATFCRNHPEREAAAHCSKYGHGYCLECLESDPHCSDPEIYCKFRPQCVIFYHLKEKRRAAANGEGEAMPDKSPYPDFIRALPQADIPMAGVTAHLMAAATGQAVFFELPAGAKVPPHSHGAQWGIIVAGGIELTIGGQTRTYAKGDAYFIGQGVEHSAVTREPCWALDIFADPGRYNPKP